MRDMDATASPVTAHTVTLTAVNWPASASAYGSLTAIVDGQPCYVTVGLDDGAVTGWHGTTTATWVADITGDLTGDQWEAVERVVSAAWDAHCDEERAA